MQFNFEGITYDHIEMVRSANGQESFQGYAVLYYDGTPATEYSPMPNVKERVMAGSFSEIIRSEKNIRLWYNHNQDFELANTATGTLSIAEDAKGIRYKAPFDPNDVDHQKVKSKILKGIAKGNSFRANGFTRKSKQGGQWIRAITLCDSFTEISICNEPAYKSALAFIRSEQDEYEAMLQRAERIKRLIAK